MSIDDEGHREALQAMFDNVANLIEQGGLDLIDLVCERVQAEQLEDERQDEEQTNVEVLQELRDAVEEAANRLGISSPWKPACQQIAGDLSESLPGGA